MPRLETEAIFNALKSDSVWMLDWQKDVTGTIGTNLNKVHSLDKSITSVFISLFDNCTMVM